MKNYDAFISQYKILYDECKNIIDPQTLTNMINCQRYEIKNIDHTTFLDSRSLSNIIEQFVVAYDNENIRDKVLQLLRNFFANGDAHELLYHYITYYISVNKKNIKFVENFFDLFVTELTDPRNPLSVTVCLRHDFSTIEKYIGQFKFNTLDSPNEFIKSLVKKFIDMYECSQSVKCNAVCNIVKLMNVFLDRKLITQKNINNVVYKLLILCMNTKSIDCFKMLLNDSTYDINYKKNDNTILMHIINTYSYLTDNEFINCLLEHHKLNLSKNADIFDNGVFHIMINCSKSSENEKNSNTIKNNDIDQSSNYAEYPQCFYSKMNSIDPMFKHDIVNYPIDVYGKEQKYDAKRLFKQLCSHKTSNVSIPNINGDIPLLKLIESNNFKYAKYIINSPSFDPKYVYCDGLNIVAKIIDRLVEVTTYDVSHKIYLNCLKSIIEKDNNCLSYAYYDTNIITHIVQSGNVQLLFKCISFIDNVEILKSLLEYTTDKQVIDIVSKRIQLVSK
jgi:hypothetical protein